MLWLLWLLQVYFQVPAHFSQQLSSMTAAKRTGASIPLSVIEIFPLLIPYPVLTRLGRHGHDASEWAYPAASEGIGMLCLLPWLQASDDTFSINSHTMRLKIWPLVGPGAACIRSNRWPPRFQDAENGLVGFLYASGVGAKADALLSILGTSHIFRSSFIGLIQPPTQPVWSHRFNLAVGKPNLWLACTCF